MRRRSLIITVAVACALVLLFGLMGVVGRMLVDYWWFSALGFGTVYVRVLVTKFWLWCLGFAVGFGAVAAGFLVARRALAPILPTGWRIGQLSLSLVAARRAVHALFWTVAVLAGLVGGSAAVPAWRRVLLFLHRVPFGSSDPIFGHDIGFYVFVYPLLTNVRSVLQASVWVFLAAAGAYYVVSNAVSGRGAQVIPERVFAFANKAIGVLFVLSAAGFLLERYSFLYSQHGASFGAGYADVHVRLPACWVMAGASLAAAAVFFTANSLSKVRRVIFSLAAWMICLALVRGVLPAAVQWARVTPNELRLESPYIKHTIALTRAAYKLDSAREVQYPVAEDMTYEDVAGDALTVDNVRLWDWRPLRDTYRQLQTIRTYYDFSDVDVDRYDLERGYTQVLLSVREMRHDRFKPEVRTWVNTRLKYTHGYGLCLSPVNEATEEGLPVFLVRDIPSVGPPAFALTSPQIYYGESAPGYVLANTTEPEFDYPVGEGNEWIHYDGRGGVRVGGLLRKTLLALYFSDMNILLSGSLKPESRALFHRRIQERVARVAPYLALDGDAYPVVHDARVMWVQDCYTHTRFFPYSQPGVNGRLNYIRNSVKAVVDAYDGDVTFYVADQGDPLIQAYAAIFPGVYRPMDEMPAGLRRHMRYPVDMFELQAEKYASFHMRDPQVFYNQEDLWEVATERYGRQAQRMESYYVLMRLPESDRAEFLLMLPFTPAGKDNMIAWLAGGCDAERYGELMVYGFPKGKWVAGPLQVEGWIDQEPEISQQLTLWGQGGSSVIRGNLLAIPIAGGILYVEPLYIQAESGAIPQLKRVIAAYGSRAAMAPTLAEALRKLFAAPREPVGAAPEAPAPEAPAPERRAGAPDVGRLVEQALDHYASAQAALQQADFAEYGRHMREVEAALNQLREAAAVHGGD